MNTDGAFCPSSAFIVLAHMQPVKRPNKKKIKTDMAKLRPHAAIYSMAAQTTAFYCAASFYGFFC